MITATTAAATMLLLSLVAPSFIFPAHTKHMYKYSHIHKHDVLHFIGRSNVRTQCHAKPSISLSILCAVKTQTHAHTYARTCIHTHSIYVYNGLLDPIHTYEYMLSYGVQSRIEKLHPKITHNEGREEKKHKHRHNIRTRKKIVYSVL